MFLFPRSSIAKKVVTLFLAAALIPGLSSCVNSSNTTQSAENGRTESTTSETSLRSIISDPALDATWQKSNFTRYYEQNIKWRECAPTDEYTPEVAEALDAAGVDLKKIQCGDVAVPLDWTDPENLQTTSVAVVYIPATGEKPKGTMLGNPGGPGSSGRGFMMGMAVSPGFEKLLDEYNLLGFDPRGIGGSQAIQCNDSQYETTTLQLGECIGNNPLTHFMGTSSVARDMELMRALMKDEKLNYLGYSYGTMLGATYATLFQDKVGRMVLDSAEDAGWASPIHRFDQQIAISRAITHLGELCKNEYQADGSIETCPFIDEKSVTELIKRLDKQPLKGAEGSEVNGTQLYDFLASTLYQSTFGRKQMMQILSLALAGDPDMIKGISDTVSSDGVAVNGAGSIVTCHSFPNDPDIPGFLEHVNRVGVPLLLGGPDISEEDLASLADLGCFALPESGYDIHDSFYAPDAAPILVIGISGDHTTPFQYAEKLNDQLGSSTLLKVDGQGHAASFQGRSSCVDEVVVNYFIEGTVPNEGTVCTDDAEPDLASEELSETETS